jgi:hypothetical protein
VLNFKFINRVTSVAAPELAEKIVVAAPRRAEGRGQVPVGEQKQKQKET